ncbi:DUF2393 family protein [Paracidobacterium acidisoli]|uniref:DUF2393 domain-containing protein n=1 Tax=Paracidobacterium acidisoli TaxID=2303751 RepID=A0A372ILL8_9BACT|nr:DUF2393 family protein [Paracidobacterium acidisoli]MBT9332466.1 DUF2393 domain-containing protein [Paracidobacterium acidisoli]
MANEPQQPEPSFLSGNHASPERPSRLPWILAGVVVLIVAGALILLGHRAQPANPGGAGLAPPDPYAASLSLSHLQMSQADTRVGGQTTYIDGQIANNGNKTLSGVTIQVAFRDFTNQLTQKETMSLSLIRTREPYVDTEPVSAAPIHPGDTRDFRLIFDHVSQDWNQQVPEIRVISVTSR